MIFTAREALILATHAKTCVCGKYTRRIKTGERTSYVPDKVTSGHTFKTSMPVFVTKLATDGLCDRCAKYGTPDYSNLSNLGKQISPNMRRDNKNKQKLKSVEAR